MEGMTSSYTDRTDAPAMSAGCGGPGGRPLGWRGPGGKEPGGGNGPRAPGGGGGLLYIGPPGSVNM